MQSTQHANSLPTYTHYSGSMRCFEQLQSCAGKTNTNTYANVHKQEKKAKNKVAENVFTKIFMFGKKSLNEALHLENCQQE